MTEKLICAYPPQYDGHIGKWAIGVAQWLYQELTKILGKLNELEQRIKALEP
jgi:hypothetical protein